jgi:hypothetical protein
MRSKCCRSGKNDDFWSTFDSGFAAEDGASLTLDHGVFSEVVEESSIANIHSALPASLEDF